MTERDGTGQRQDSEIQPGTPQPEVQPATPDEQEQSQLALLTLLQAVLERGGDAETVYPESLRPGLQA